MGVEYIFFPPEKANIFGDLQAAQEKEELIGFWSSGCCGFGRSHPDCCPSLSLSCLDGQWGLLFLSPPGPSPGAEGQQGSIAVSAVDSFGSHLTYLLTTGPVFDGAITLDSELDSEVHQQ